MKLGSEVRGREIVVNNTRYGGLSVSVAILTWNRSEYVLRALESVYRQTYKPLEVVVVDSASNDGTLERIKARFPNVKLIRLYRNMGCPEGRNIAMANCQGDIIFSLDDDAFLEKDVLELCMNEFAENEKVGVVACTISSTSDMASKIRLDHSCKQFSGGACALRKKALEVAGYYPSDFFRQAEEGDLRLRLMESGYEILACPPAVVYHASAPINRDQRLFLFYSVRNELYIVFRRYPWILVIPGVLYKMLVWNIAGVRKRAFMYTMLGTFAAFLQVPRLLHERKAVSLDTIRNIRPLKA